MTDVVRIPKRFVDRIRLMGLPLEEITEGRWVGWYLGPSWVIPLLELVGEPLESWTPDDAPIRNVDWDALFRKLAAEPALGAAVASVLLLSERMTPNAFIAAISPLVDVPLYPTREIGAARRGCQTSLEKAFGWARATGEPMHVDPRDFEGAGMSVPGKLPLNVKMEVLPNGQIRVSTRASPAATVRSLKPPKKTP